MAALSLRPTLTEVLKVLTLCHGATLHSVARCAIQGHVSLDPHGWDAPSSHGREDYAKAVGLPFRAETKASCVSVWSRTRSLHLLRYVSPPYLTPSLTRCGTIAAQVGRPFHTDTQASCVSVGYRHGSPHLLRLAEAMCHSMPPCHEGDTHRTLKTSYAYVPTLPLCHVPDARKVAQIIMTAAMAVA